MGKTRHLGFANLPSVPYRVLVLTALAMLLLTASLLLAQPSWAEVSQEEEVPDVNCPEPWEYGFVGHRRFAQTFTAERSGELDKVWFKVHPDVQGADFVVEVRAVDDTGVPTNTVLASAEINDVSAGPNDPVQVTADFAPGTPVKAGEEYALSITGVSGQRYWIAGREENPCSGKMYVDTEATGEFDTGDTQDLVYAVFVSDAPPTVDVKTSKLRNAVVRVHFSEPIDATTLMDDPVDPTRPSTSKTIKLFKEDAASTASEVPAKVRCTDASCTSLVLDPDVRLGKGKTYTVRIEGGDNDGIAGVADLGGNELAQDFTRSFKTGRR